MTPSGHCLSIANCYLSDKTLHTTDFILVVEVYVWRLDAVIALGLYFLLNRVN